ncbi:macrolide transport system ATP-binding/permease protein [Fictibacillus solisalsi]|uniref:Macrolide transport system ATP-binding/permease protein n=1 Tax=Fictibacillus solisalsi TaxID=459525 RepID=A0A1H0AC30_9BACL|nr:ABC-F type ribosomal protection protein [Fictibacillus solisalsi]SDN31192.1 macrolide transport system ATP-binding/permease protein [Fictibacillus solisalsi]
MLLLETTDLEKSFKDKLIVQLKEPLLIHSGDRIGVVGQNGAGKTTLMHMLAGEEPVDKGEVHVYGKISSVFQTAREAETSEKLKKKWGLNHKMYSSMSGGEKTRLCLAAALEKEPDLLFMDEPTSHLDLDGILQLEQELSSFKGAVVVISHDRAFLDQVCTKIIEIADTVPSFYTGNYSSYQKQKEHKLTRQQFEYETYTKERRRLKEAAKAKTQKVKSMKKKPSRMSYSEAKLGKGKVKSKQAAMMKNVKAMKKRMEQLEKKEKPKEMEYVQFDIAKLSPVHARFAVQVNDMEKTVGQRQLFHEVSFAVKPGMKVALTGPNGCGKTTLMNMILRGHSSVTASQALKIGYFHQNLENVDGERTILENVSEQCPYSKMFVRTVLARMLFKQEDVHKKVKVLSGGERVKTALAKIFLGDFNLLLLDEPTNYLDIFTREALEHVLSAYPGTILFATHDRQLMNQVADHLLVFKEGKCLFFQGNYAAFEQQHAKEIQQEPFVAQEELLTLELERADLIGRLSMPGKGAEKEMLEQRYQELLQSIQQIKQNMN